MAFGEGDLHSRVVELERENAELKLACVGLWHDLNAWQAYIAQQELKKYPFLKSLVDK